MKNNLINHLQQLGINNPTIIHNPSYDDLYNYELDPKLVGPAKAFNTNSGALAVDTDIFTGRSPKDKYIVLDQTTQNTFWWNTPELPNDNKPISPQVWQELKELVITDLNGKQLFVVDCFCGAHHNTRLNVRVITPIAWQAHFVTNMFIRPSKEELAEFKPSFTVINASTVRNLNFKQQGLNSETFIAFNLTEKIQLIGGTWYGGEMKKGLFSLMNYYLPLQGIASMHCSANQGIKDKDVALFFGLSGTGKTTLSTDPKRLLIGDDEHGWDDEGVFNFEGGCYAKVINLSKEQEPDIFNAIKRDALLENVVIDADGNIDFNDASKTQNTRVSYPIHHIQQIVKPKSVGGHAKRVILLTADAYGVLPPVSILSDEQMKYYFLSGFTSKLAGTERGINQPTPTFSACFGAAFLSLHPFKYAEVLAKRMADSNAKAYLVNTGWNGSGNRISLKATRAIIDAILSGEVDNAPTAELEIFGLHYPTHINAIEDPSILDPRASYQSSQLWQDKASELAQKFIANFGKYHHDEQQSKLQAAGPKI